MMDHLPLIERIAIEGYVGYHSGHPLRAWELISAHERERWLAAAASEALTPRALRQAYYDETRIKPTSWADLPSKSRERWKHAWEGMHRERVKVAKGGRA